MKTKPSPPPPWRAATRVMLLALLLALPLGLCAQDAQFGGHAGVAIVRLRFENPGPPPQAGWAIGTDANVAIDKNGLIRFMPQAGYILSNTEGSVDPLNPLFSNRTGRPLPLDTRVRVLTHLFQGAMLLKFSNNSDDRFGLYLGPALHYVLGQTLVFEIPVQGQDETVRETISGYDGDRTFWMAYLGIEARFTPPKKLGVYGYLQSYHQLNQDPVLPAGVTFGVKVLF